MILLADSSGRFTRQEFDGLVGHAVDLVDGDLGLADLELIALAAHLYFTGDKGNTIFSDDQIL